MSSVRIIKLWQHDKCGVILYDMSAMTPSQRPFSCYKCESPSALEYKLIVDGASGHPYLKHNDLCPDCVKAAEDEFIMRMPIEDLPLWIDHEWIVDTNKQSFLTRLEQGV